MCDYFAWLEFKQLAEVQKETDRKPLSVSECRNCAWCFQEQQFTPSHLRSDWCYVACVFYHRWNKLLTAVFLYFRCECLPGYSGKHCEIDDDDCVGHKCRHGAVCVDAVNGYTCVCPQGFRYVTVSSPYELFHTCCWGTFFTYLHPQGWPPSGYGIDLSFLRGWMAQCFLSCSWWRSERLNWIQRIEDSCFENSLAFVQCCGNLPAHLPQPFLVKH